MKRKKYCPETTKRSALISLLMMVFVGMVFVFVVMPIYRNKIKREITKESNVVATYNLLNRNIGCGLLIDKIKKIERGYHEARKKHGTNVSIYSRLTDKEFEQYTMVLYVGQHADLVDPIGFVANTCGETGFIKNAKSYVNACGLNQIMTETFNIMNRNCLFKFGHYDIFDVKHNTEASLKYWIQCRNYLKHILNRPPTVNEIAMSYNNNYLRVAAAIKNGTVNRLASETITHGKKVQFYYDSFIKESYSVYWTGEKK